MCSARSSDDPIGLVHVDLSPLLMRSAHGVEEDQRTINGWFPIYDTLRGVRGELSLDIKLSFFGDSEWDAGVMFFSFSSLEPSCYTVQLFSRLRQT